MDRGKRAEFRPGKVGSHSPAAAGERWTSERPSSDQGALFKAATSKLRAGVRRRRGMAELRKGLLEEEAPRLPACPPSRGRVLMGGGVLTGACPHGGVSSRGHVLTGACPHGGRVLTVSPQPRAGDSGPQGRQPPPCLFARLLPVFLLLCLVSQGEHPSVGSPLSGSPKVPRSALPHSLMSAV